METLWQDLRYGMRVLLKHPGFTAVAVITLALGIGASSALFSILNAVLLRPLPFEEPGRLVMVFETNRAKGWDQFMASPPNFGDWRDQNQVFEQTAAFRNSPFNLAGGAEPERIPGARVSSSLFSLLHVKPALGRAFSDEEDQPGHDQVVIIGHGLWQRRFGGDPNLVGQALSINSKSYSVIGVMPPDFQFPSRAELWAPIAFNTDDLRNRGTHFISVIARLKRGVTLAQAQAEMDVVARRLEQHYPNSNSGWGARVIPLLEVVVGNIRRALQVLFGAVALLLMIACANVANLLLARATARRKELAIRTALGAGSGRLVRQLLTESVTLALFGGALGLLLAWGGVKLIVSVSPESIPRAAQIAVDGQVLGFTCLVSLLTGLVFGLLPAFQAAQPKLNELLKSTTVGGSRHSVRSLLVASEVALSLVLLIGAGLLIKSFLRLREVNPGFNPQHVLTLQINLPPAKYREDVQRAEFLKQAVQRIRTLPGVEAAGVTTTLPFVGDNLNGFVIEGRAALAPNEVPSANYYAVSPDYFRALGIPLLQGRYFTEQDASDAPRVVVINETLARRYFPNEDPVGKRMRITDRTTTMREIVGVVSDVRQYGMEGAQTAQMYEPYLQNPLNFITLAVRTTGDPINLAGAVRKQVFAVDQDQPVSNVKTMEQIISDSIAPRRLTMLLLGVFAAVALLLAAVGIYGLMSHAVGQRKHEIGVRLALGARPRDVFKLVLGQGLMLALLGVVVGLAASFALTRVMTRLLYGVSARDILTFGLVSLLLIAVAWLASYIPARRAAKVEPMEALRCE